MGLKEIAKYKAKVKIGEEEYTFTEPSISDHIEIERKYPSFDGDLIDLIRNDQIPSLEAIPFILSLMLKEEHDDIIFDDLVKIPARLLPNLYRDVMFGLFGSEEEQDDQVEIKKKEEIQIGNL